MSNRAADKKQGASGKDSNLPADKGKGDNEGTSLSAGKNKGRKEEEDVDEEEDDDDEDGVGDSDDAMDEEDDYEEIDPTAIRSRRTRGKKVDYTSPEALAKAGLKPQDMEEDDD